MLINITSSTNFKLYEHEQGSTILCIEFFDKDPVLLKFSGDSAISVLYKVLKKRLKEDEEEPEKESSSQKYYNDAISELEQQTSKEEVKRITNKIPEFITQVKMCEVYRLPAKHAAETLIGRYSNG